MIRVKKKKVPVGAILGTLILLLIILAIISGIHQAKKNIASSAKDRLYETIRNIAVHAYSIEAQYPMNLEYMKKNYHLNYDEERFFVDYQLIMGNAMPEIFIIDREEEVIESEVSQE